MTEDIYPWGGDFTACDQNGCVAVVLLNLEYVPPDEVAIYGHLKTENIGVEKIVANVISNPYIRFVVVCGEDIRGHRAGESIIALHQNGIDDNHRIIGSPGAIPYIENINEESIIRFQQQVRIIDALGICDKEKIDGLVCECQRKNPGCFGESFIAIRLVRESNHVEGDLRALHASIQIDYLGHIKNRSGE